MEKNEKDWFSLWGNVKNLQGIQVIYNVVFKDDPLFNHGTSIKIRNDSINVIRTAEKTFTSLGMPSCIYVGPMDDSKGLEKLLVDSGYKVYDDLVTMDCIVREHPTVRSELDLRRITLPEVKDWCDVYMEAFAIGESWKEEVYGRVRQLHVKSEVAFLAAYMEEEIVGVASVYSNGGTSGLYCLGTFTSERRKGVGSALVERSIVEAGRAGSKVLYLQFLQRDQLEGFYKALGFRVRYSKTIYLKG